MINIGIICPSEIAFRRFLPALMKCPDIKYQGVAVASMEEWFGEKEGDTAILQNEIAKARKFQEQYGGKIYNSYHELLADDKIDAVYIPLPPGLHHVWGKEALLSGRHVFMEKPFTDSLEHTEELIKLAADRKLALHENYMFIYHSQIEYIKKRIMDKTVGDTRLIRIDFGFPFRGANDFRYSKELGGGALLDCGGYTVKLAALLLGESCEVVTSHLETKEPFEVDIYGSATMRNRAGLTVQLAFGMDNSYKCSIEIWGSEGTVFTNRILTAPEDFQPTVTITNKQESKDIILPADDAFYKSICAFTQLIENEEMKIEHYNEICQQSKRIEQIIQGEQNDKI